jgi:hypothetical protein
MTDLPTRATIFTNCGEALDEAGVALSNARHGPALFDLVTFLTPF